MPVTSTYDFLADFGRHHNPSPGEILQLGNSNHPPKLGHTTGSNLEIPNWTTDLTSLTPSKSEADFQDLEVPLEADVNLEINDQLRPEPSFNDHHPPSHPVRSRRSDRLDPGRVFLEAELDQPRLSTVQSLVTLSMYEEARARDARGWFYGGAFRQVSYPLSAVSQGPPRPLYGNTSRNGNAALRRPRPEL
ncbi:hypothetical protein ACJZ2D_008564 [Fusarium nematophilum]